MSSVAVLFAIAAISPSGTWAGASTSAPSVTLTIKSGKVVKASAWISQYTCELGGSIGPVQMKVRPRVRITRAGAINFNAGGKSHKLRARLRLRGGRIIGKIRIVGNLDGPCSTPLVTVTLTRQ